MKKVLLLISVFIFMFTACSGNAKPPKDEVTNNLASVVEKELGNNNDQAGKYAKDYAECVMRFAYDDISADVLNQINEANTIVDIGNISGSQKDKEILDNAASNCQDKLTQEEK